MTKNQIGFKTKGMNRDTSVSAFSPEFAFENVNLRLATNEGNTLLSWVNEKGTAEIELESNEPTGIQWDNNPDHKTHVTSLVGTTIGIAVINHQLIIFTTVSAHDGISQVDYIYALKYSDPTKQSMKALLLYSGSLGFDVNCPIETKVSYEAEDIQKVYWIDGKNQPRLINVAKWPYNDIGTSIYTKTSFDFVPALQLNETVKVQKQLSGSGLFAPGVIQYALTYYNKYGQESNIFYTSPLLYISYRDRGANPEDKVENSFKITITNPDIHFDFIRIYSIQRTSIDATPFCKRVQDVSLEGVGTEVSYIDTGASGNSIDPTELLYKGGEIISAGTMEQKDNTLFLGNLSVERLSVSNIEGISVNIDNTTSRTFKAEHVSSSNYEYSNQLTSTGITGTLYQDMTVPCGGFMTDDWYRLGVQFQHESGKWSEPIPICNEDYGNKYFFSPTGKFEYDEGEVTVPTFKGKLEVGQLDTETGRYSNIGYQSLLDAGYKKVRPVVVFPNMLDRKILCQCVAAPAMHIVGNTDTPFKEVQSSWFFRPYLAEDQKEDNKSSRDIFTPKSKGILWYNVEKGDFGEPETTDPFVYRAIEIEGNFDKKNKFEVDRFYRTLHSPDIEFDSQIQLVDFKDKKYQQIGREFFISTLSDIEIQTSSPTVSNLGSGFVHKEFSSSNSVTGTADGIVAGLFYDDFQVDDYKSEDANPDNIRAWDQPKQSSKWLVYPWQGTGSLNNDINRPANKGTATAQLKKKVISNLRYAKFIPDTTIGGLCTFSVTPQLFASDELSILKFNDTLNSTTNNKYYKGNIDTLLMPDNPDGTYFASDGLILNYKSGILALPYISYEDKKTSFLSKNWWKTYSDSFQNTDGHPGVRWYDLGIKNWVVPRNNTDNLGDFYLDLAVKKLSVRMKYKSTPHLFAKIPQISENDYQLGVINVIQESNDSNDSTRFGGSSKDAFKENVWLPCGEPVRLDNITTHNENQQDEYQSIDFEYAYGDTYFQRYDCLKTYPFTREDLNQIVEIGSFMLATRINIDGRYDRNRGQINNLNMSPQNFNLINPVYSQKDNFFSYKILDDDIYKNTYYPNQITWSKTKTNGADVDMWTNVTLASVLELDGDKGQLNSIQRLNDQLIAFQDSGISQILYNENVQIQSTEGVPIEIANSGKVQGKRYLSSTIGCSNKWSIANTPIGIYFMDSNDKSIYLFNGQLTNLSQQGGFNSWCKQNIPDMTTLWNPTFPKSNNLSSFTACYDKMNQDVLWINKDTALAWSEKLQTFTSFYSYGNSPFFVNLDDTGIWLKNNSGYTQTWKHRAGEYCNFFGELKDYSMTLIGNPNPLLDKIFTNLEFRACVEDDGSLKTITVDGEEQSVFNKPYLPFDYLETWNEYQHGYTTLENKNGHSAMLHGVESSALKRKFRIWRCDIPRNNCLLDSEREEGTKYPYSLDADINVSRHVRKSIDRMRNPWIYLKLSKSSYDSTDIPKTEIHDIVMTYYT